MEKILVFTDLKVLSLPLCLRGDPFDIYWEESNIIGSWGDGGMRGGIYV